MALMAYAKPRHVPKFGLANGRIIGGHEAEPRMYRAAFYLQSIFILTNKVRKSRVKSFIY